MIRTITVTKVISQSKPKAKICRKEVDGFPSVFNEVQTKENQLVVWLSCRSLTYILLVKEEGGQS